jgi:poly(A) polymerase
LLLYRHRSTLSDSSSQRDPTENKMDVKNTSNSSAKNGNTSNGSNGNANGNTTIKYPGVTSPISLAMPKPADHTLSQELEACLRSFDLFESEDEMNHRMQILSEVNELFKRFVQTVSEQKKMPPEVANQMNGKIFTFGSFRLGVHTRGLLRLIEL